MEDTAQSWIAFYNLVEDGNQHPALKYITSRENRLYFSISSDDDVVSSVTFFFSIDTSGKYPRVLTLDDDYNKSVLELEWLSTFKNTRDVTLPELLSLTVRNFDRLLNPPPSVFDEILSMMTQNYFILDDDRVRYTNASGVTFIISGRNTMVVSDRVGRHVRQSGLVIQNGLTPQTWDTQTLIENLESIRGDEEAKTHLLEGDVELLKSSFIGRRVILGKLSGQRNTNVVFASEDLLRDMKEESGLRCIIIEAENGMKTCCAVSIRPLTSRGELSLSSIENLGTRVGKYCTFRSTALPHVKECFFSRKGDRKISLEFLDRYPTLTTGEKLSNGLIVEKMLDSQGIEILMGRVYDPENTTVVTLL